MCVEKGKPKKKSSPLQNYLDGLTPEAREIVKMNIKASCHDGHHGIKDGRKNGFTKRHHNFGKRFI